LSEPAVLPNRSIYLACAVKVNLLLLWGWKASSSGGSRGSRVAGRGVRGGEGSDGRGVRNCDGTKVQLGLNYYNSSKR
jgi:hypothetical protein